MQSVVGRYMNPNLAQNSHARALESTTRTRIADLNRCLDEILEEKEHLKQHNECLDEINNTRQKGWWEETPIESLNMQQVKERIQWFQTFKDLAESRIEELKNGESSSALIQQQNLPSVPGSSTGVGLSSYAPGPYTLEMAAEQFADPSSTGHFLYASSSQNPSTCDNSGQFLLPPPSQDPSAGDGSGHIPADIFFPPMFPDLSGSDQFFSAPPTQDPSTAGGFIPSQFFIPPRSLNSSTSGGGTQDSSTVGGSIVVGSSYDEEEGNYIVSIKP